VKHNYLEEFIRANPSFCDAAYTCLLAEDNFIITPETIYNKKRIYYKIIEYENLIDSTNITINNWIKIATTIEENYDKFDSFLILHGTDTMAYVNIFNFKL